MTAIIITDEVKLRALIQEEVSRAMPKSSSLKDEIDSITLEVAVSFLAETNLSATLRRNIDNFVLSEPRFPPVGVGLSLRCTHRILFPKHQGLL